VLAILGTSAISTFADDVFTTTKDNPKLYRSLDGRVLSAETANSKVPWTDIGALLNRYVSTQKTICPHQKER
jgi:hypothetical protein